MDDQEIQQSNENQSKILPLNEIKSEVTRFTNDMLKREITGKILGNTFCGDAAQGCDRGQTRAVKTKLNNLPVFLIIGHSSYDIFAEMDDSAASNKQLTIKRPPHSKQAYFQLPYDTNIEKNKFVVYTTAAGAWGMLDAQCNEGPGHILNNTNRKIKESLFSASGNTQTRVLIGTQRSYAGDFTRYVKGEHTASYFIPGSRVMEKGHQLSDNLLSGGGFGIIRLNSTLASAGLGAATGTALMEKWANSPDVAKSWMGYEEDTDFIIEEIIEWLKKINKKEGELGMPDLHNVSERPFYKFLHKYQNDEEVKEAFNKAFDEAADEAAAAAEKAFQRSADVSLGNDKKELEKAEKEEMKARERAETWEAWRGRGHEFFEGFESEDEDDVVVDCKGETKKERIQNLYYLTSDGKLTKKDKELKSLMFKKAKACNQLWMSEIIQTGDPGIYISLACSSIYAYLRMAKWADSAPFVNLDIQQGADETGSFYQFYNQVTGAMNNKIVPANNQQWDDMTKQLGYEQRTTTQEEKEGTRADISVYDEEGGDQATDSARISHEYATRERTKEAKKAAKATGLRATIQKLIRKRRRRSPQRYSPSAHNGGGRNRRTRKKSKKKRQTTRKRKYKKGTRVYRCVHKLKKKYPIGNAIAICQKSTQQGYKSGKKLSSKRGKRGGRRKRQRRRTRRRKRRAGAWCRCTEAEARAQKKKRPNEKI